MTVTPDVRAHAPAGTLTTSGRAWLMTATKLRMMRNGLRRSVARTIGYVLGALWALGAAGIAALGLVGLRWQDAALAADVTTVGFAALTMGWTLLPLLVFGVDETLDPARFALLPVRARELMPGLLAAGLAGIPGIATVLVAAAGVATWTRGVAPVVAGVIAAVLGVLTCVLIARVLTSAFSRVLRSRRFRDFATALLAVVMGSLGLGLNIAIGSMSGSGTDAAELRRQLHRVALIGGDTPFGWAWSLPGLVAGGHWVTAGLHLLLALALVAALAWAWERLLARNLTSPADLGGSGTHVGAAAGLVDRLYPDTPTGAVASRCLRYWRRDPRYVSSIAAAVVVPALFIGSQLIGSNGSRSMAAFAPLLIAFLVSTSLSQDTAYDGSALWVHLSTGISGRADRAGRVLALFTWAVPVQLIALPVVLVWTGRGSLWPIVVGTTVAAMCAGTGVASVVSARWLSPAPAAGGNPFASSGGAGIGALVALAANGIGTGVLLIPVVGLSIGSIWVDWLRWAALGVGVVTGVAALIAGVTLGGRLLERRWPEVLAAVSTTT
jgi:ABC-2 type transport system permease protein